MPRYSDELIPTRASLINRLKDWDDGVGWRRFFDTYWKLIYGVARQSGLTNSEAQDVVQETMASVAKHMPTFVYDPAVGSFKCWLLNMTRWRITDHFRKRIPTAQPFGSDAQTPLSETSLIERLPDPSTLDLDAVWEREWQANLLEAAKAKVRVRTDPEKFQIFDLYVRNEAPPDKIARLYGITVSQVYVIKHRVAEAVKAEVRRLENEAF